MKRLILLSLLTLVSCAEKSIETTTQISLGATAGVLSNSFDGGLFFMAYNEETKEVLKYKVLPDSNAYYIPNGDNWKFGAIGWKNAVAGKFTGDAYCSFSEEFHFLDGTPITLPTISTNMNNCDQGPFGGKSNKYITTSNEIPPIKFIYCKNDSQNVIDVSSAGTHCSAPSMPLYISLKYSSFSDSKIDSHFNIIGEHHSECVAIDEKNAGVYKYKISEIRSPIYEDLPVSIGLYTDATCSDKLRDIDMPFGFKAGHPDILTQGVRDASGPYNFILIKE